MTMTREEAIEVMKAYRDKVINSVSNQLDGDIEALDMAIQALSQEPTEKPMCDRNICISNEYNGIGCDKCIVNKAEQEPTTPMSTFDIAKQFGIKLEPCTDAVSRQAILDGIEELKKSPWATDKRGNGFEYLITEALDVVADLCVKQEPSVTPQKSGHFIDGVHAMGYREGYKDAQKQKSGKWIDKDLRKEEYVLTGKCSVCGQVRVIDKYCSNCGAKMESEDKE